jgi:hypothetical protein
MSDTPAHAALSRSDEIAVLEALDRIAGSGALGAGERLPAMLRWLVREELGGRGERIKGAAVATEVLGRGESFDPQGDSIARAEMGRLRKALEHYYLTDGAAEPVRIVIPKGSYRPQIRVVPVEQAVPDIRRPARSAATWRRWAALVLLIALAHAALYLTMRGSRDGPGPAPTLIIQSVTVEPDTPAGRGAAEGLAGELAAQLAHAAWLTVILPPQGASAVAPASARPGVYALDVRITQDGRRFAARTFLKRASDNAVRWSRTYAGGLSAGDIDALVKDTARLIADDLGRSDGVITSLEAIRTDGNMDEAQTQFSCLLTARRFWRTFDPSEAQEAARCMRARLEAEPASAEARAVLALLHVDAARGLAGVARDAELSRASALLQPVAAQTQLAQTARLALAACRSDTRGVVRIAGELAARFPNDPSTLADIGSKLGLAAGEWELALAHEARALAMNPYPEPWYPVSTAVKALKDNAPAKALAALGAAPQRGFVTGNMLLLAAGSLLRDRAVTDAASRELGLRGLATLDAQLARIDGECWSDDVKSLLRDALSGR